MARWRQIIAEPEASRRTTLVFALDGRVAGFGSHGPARDEDAAGAGELMALYVDPPAQGAGVGRTLLEAVEARLEAEGFPEAVLRVFAANGAARAFYEHRGWRLEPGTLREDAWAPDVRYRRPLKAF